jgi:hypothetical protein
MRGIPTTLIILIFLLGNLSLTRTIGTAQSLSSTTLEPDSGSVVCSPGIYKALPDGCLPLGPSQYLTHAAAENIPYPLYPLPAYSPDAGLVETPYQYFKLTDEGAVLYLFPTLEDAMASSVSNQSLGPGEVIVSYGDQVVNDSGVFYRIQSGDWIRGSLGGKLAMYQPFQGLLFSSTPHNSFGWVLEEIPSTSSPGYNAPLTGNTYYRYNVVQIFAIQESEGNTWLMIGPDEWLDYHKVSRIDPRISTPDGVSGNRWIEVNLDEQTLSVYQDGRLIFATLVSTGIDKLWTRPGIFQIYEKKPSETMSGATEADRSDYYFLEDVPWTMYFDENRALHGAYWHNSFGYQRSHGCVNLSDGDSHWLFDWANVGDTVYVYDPSGKTPMD